MRRTFKPSQVHRTTTALLDAKQISKPPWYDVIGSLPPTQALIRKQPVPHQPRRLRKSNKKATKLFQPQKITYEEDLLRNEFFKDHPWELARPRMVIENDGRDMHSMDWSQIEQERSSLSGESVIQHQRWLLDNNESLTRAQAYDKARKEFYDLRLQEDIERRVAKEEALATGAYFGKSAIEIGMDIEDKQWDEWKHWAEGAAEITQQQRLALTSGLYVQESDVEERSPGTELLDESPADAEETTTPT